jgi:hypothetical protein
MRAGTKVKRDKNGNVHGGGRHRFEPTNEQRAFVSTMAGFRMTLPEIASLIIDPHTNKSISRITLIRKFHTELHTARPKLKTLIQTKYLEQLRGNRWEAIRWGLAHLAGFTEDAAHPSLATTLSIEGHGPNVPSVEVKFVLPTPKPEDQIVDVTPQREPDYSLKALEPPPERRRGPLGWLEEKPPESTDWLK